jgi:hypothetical protein
MLVAWLSKHMDQLGSLGQITVEQMMKSFRVPYNRYQRRRDRLALVSDKTTTHDAFTKLTTAAGT